MPSVVNPGECPTCDGVGHLPTGAVATVRQCGQCQGTGQRIPAAARKAFPLMAEFLDALGGGNRHTHWKIDKPAVLARQIRQALDAAMSSSAVRP